MTQRNPFSLPYLEPDSRAEWGSSLLSSSGHPGSCGPGVSLGEKKAKPPEFLSSKECSGQDREGRQEHGQGRDPPR